MSNQPDKPWTEEEKNFLLTEILKKAGISSAYLYKIITENHITPSWMDIPLPPGRSLHACQSIYYRMERESTMMQPQHRQSLPGPTAPLQISPGLKKRPLAPLSSDKMPSLPRAIQPKPSSPASHFPVSTESHPISPMTTSAVSPGGEPPRKRGRPSKAEMQRRSMMAQARGEPYPPARRPLPKPTLMTSPIGLSTGAEQSPIIRGSPQIPGVRATDVSHGGPGGILTPRMDVPGGASQGKQVQAPPGPQLSVGGGTPPVVKLAMEPGESTPRQRVEDQMVSKPPPSFQGVHQASSAPPSPNPGTPAVSSAATAESGADTSQTTTEAAPAPMV